MLGSYYIRKYHILAATIFIILIISLSSPPSYVSEQNEKEITNEKINDMNNNKISDKINYNNNNNNNNNINTDENNNNIPNINTDENNNDADTDNNLEKDDGNIPFDNNNQINSPEPIETIYFPEMEIQNSQAEHYNLLIIISSPVAEFKFRRLIREYLFDLSDNLEPCMKLDADIYYKFLIQPHRESEYRKDVLQKFAAELVEYNDMIELNNEFQQSWQETILRWISSLKYKQITFNHAIILDVHTIINIDKIQQTLKTSNINVFDMTDEQKRNLVWGFFEDINNSNMFAVLGEGAIEHILNYKDKVEHFENLITQVYYYYHDNPDENLLHFVNDNLAVFEWKYSDEVDPIYEEDTTIAIVDIYSDDEMFNLFNHLNFPKKKVCNPRDIDNLDKPSIAIVTSSYLYDDMCMLPAILGSAKNKREYALKHGYSFVARSTEFIQQKEKRRKIVWGKIDALENALPYYDWLFWMDMDSLIANPNIKIENLLDNFISLVDGKENFENIHLIMSRPSRDFMVNAGVFLIRNSDWSQKFLKELQSQRRYFNRKMYEQAAIWRLIQKPEFKNQTLLLDQDDHTFNTFPRKYVRGDFIIHFAPDGCPAKKIRDALVKLKKLLKNPQMKISFK